MFDINQITRENIKSLQPYSSARSEYKGEADVWLDANESPYETEFNRYPDPKQTTLKEVLAEYRQVDQAQIFIGNGSDEIIDLLFRAFCEPNVDKAYILTPTYGMYGVLANLNNVEVVDIPLQTDFELPSMAELKANINSKGLLFICSPNNPTGTTYALKKINEIAELFEGLVVVDEAYIDFSDVESALILLTSTPNLVVSQTMSKAFGLAGLRLGMAFAHPDVIATLNKIKPPYNVNSFTQREGVERLKDIKKLECQVSEQKIQRVFLFNELTKLSCVKKVYPSQANFILVVFEDVQRVFEALRRKGIIVRNRSNEVESALRISVGLPAQNILLLNELKSL